MSDENDTSVSGTERFSHAGLDCKIVQTDMGHWCGYVQTPDDLGPVRWTSDYDSKYDEFLDAEVDVWGGITYGPDDEGWVGFDDAHSRALAAMKGYDQTKPAIRAQTEKLAEQIVQLNTGSGQGDDNR